MTWRIVAAACLLIVLAMGLERSLPSGELRDFGSFVASAAAAGRGDDPYGIHPLTFHVVLPGFDLWNPNLNPPISVLLFRAFLAVPPQQAFRCWWTLSLLCYVLTVALLAYRYPRRHVWLTALWSFALAGFWDTLSLGQIYLPLVLAAVLAWLLLDRGHAMAAGVLIGIVVAVKPNFAAWPLILLAAGYSRPALSAFATCAAVSALPLITDGSDIYRQWVQLVLGDNERPAFLTNASLAGLAFRAGHPAMGLAAAIAILSAATVFAGRRPLTPMRASALGIAVGIAASPIAWVHYTLFLLPVFYVLRTSPMLMTSAALLVIPVPAVLAFLGVPGWQQLTIGSAYNWAVLLCLAASGVEAFDVRLTARGMPTDAAAILRPSRRAACRSVHSR